MPPLRLPFALACVLPVLAQFDRGRNLMLDPPGLTSVTALELEEKLAGDPGDDQIRMRLLRYYFLQAMAPQRAKHIYWMIENRPESGLHAQPDLLMRPRIDGINTPELYERGRALWARAVERQPEHERVLINAARYVVASDQFESERLLNRARRMPPVEREATDTLVWLYAHAVANRAAEELGVRLNPDGTTIAFRDHVAELLASTKEAVILGRVGQALTKQARFPLDSPPPTEIGHLFEQLREYGAGLLERARSLDPANAEWRQ